MYKDVTRKRDVIVMSEFFENTVRIYILGSTEWAKYSIQYYALGYHSVHYPV